MRLLIFITAISLSMNLLAKDTTIKILPVMSNDAIQIPAEQALERMKSAYDLLPIARLIDLEILNGGSPMPISSIPQDRGMTAFECSQLLRDNNQISNLRELTSADVIIVFIGNPLLDNCGFMGTFFHPHWIDFAENGRIISQGAFRPNVNPQSSDFGLDLSGKNRQHIVTVAQRLDCATGPNAATLLMS